MGDCLVKRLKKKKYFFSPISWYCLTALRKIYNKLPCMNNFRQTKEEHCNFTNILLNPPSIEKFGTQKLQWSIDRWMKSSYL